MVERAGADAGAGLGQPARSQSAGKSFVLTAEVQDYARAGPGRDPADMGVHLHRRAVPGNDGILFAHFGGVGDAAGILILRCGAAFQQGVQHLGQEVCAQLGQGVV